MRVYGWGDAPWSIYHEERQEKLRTRLSLAPTQQQQQQEEGLES